MSTEKYQPVACELHSQLELLAMHRSPVQLTAWDEQGNKQDLVCRVTDIRTFQGAEYLVVETENTSFEFRLDKILSFSSRKP